MSQQSKINEKKCYISMYKRLEKGDVPTFDGYPVG